MHVDALRQGCLFYNVPEPVQKNELKVGFEVFMAVVQMIVILQVVTLCSKSAPTCRKNILQAYAG